MEDYEISVQELSKRDANSYILIDIRDDSSYSYGNIPGSLHVPKDILEADYEKYEDKPLILFRRKRFHADGKAVSGTAKTQSFSV